MKNPFLKFYTSDWRADPVLRMCSLAARGLWLEMICLMHEATPYGHLLVSGQPVTETQLAALAGTTPEQITALLGELESVAVFSRTRAGVIYSRKLTRMAKKASISRKNGRKGGNPSLSKERENSPWDNPEYNQEDKPQKPEARSQNKGISSLRSDTPLSGGSSARGAPPDGQTVDLQQILTAMGFPHGVVSPSKIIGTSADRAEVQRWLDLPGMSMEIVCDEIRRIVSTRQDDPPESVTYFRRAMQRLSGRLTAAGDKLEPIRPYHDKSSDRPDWMEINIDPNDYDEEGRRIRPPRKNGAPQ